MGLPSFPVDFVWGVATSAQQIEGAATADGRGESIWDRFAAEPGRIVDGARPDPACDHYRRWREDLDRLRWLGVNAYRFSTAWTRILPTGRGPVNAAGIDFYSALVDALLEAGIEPFLTLNHWDLPQALETAGGWPARATALAFADYAELVARALGDRVRFWVTHNEPWCVATLGYEEGAHAPGGRSPEAALRAAHHLLLGHGLAVERIRAAAPGAQVGIVLNLSPGLPASDSPADRDAARQFDGLFNRWYLDPLLRGRYPADAVADRVRRGHLPGGELPFVAAGDLERIAAPLDYLGVNYYGRTILSAGPDGQPRAVPPAPPAELTAMGWEVHPAGLLPLLQRLAQEYAAPTLYITENGAAFADPPPAGGRIADPQRVNYLREHLAAAHRAIAAGLPLAGYFVWTLFDNFEWNQGYTKRFGLYGMDLATGERAPKDSAFWYRDTIAAQAVAAPGPRTARRIP